MTHFKAISLIGALAITLSANALDINNLVAGQLKDANIPADETSLRISGSMNAADFAFIFDSLNSLEHLDISATQIVAYQGDVLKYTGMNNSPANTLPAYSLTGLLALKSIDLPSSLKTIGKGALSGCGITSLVIPSGVAQIQDYAFMRCPNLERIVIPSSVSSIGTRALAYCPKLSEVEIAANISSIPEGLFEACGGLQTLSLDKLSECSEIGQWALADCNGITTLVLPSQTSDIEKAALYGTSGIATVILPANLSYIGDVAMANMSGLTDINASAVLSVPQLGQNVWSGVDQSKVKLLTPDGQQDSYRASDQWDLFDIVQQSSTQNVSSTIDGSQLNVVVGGGILTVSSHNASLGNVSVFDAAGHKVSSAQGDHVVSFNVSNWPTNVYLIVTSSGVAKITL